MNHDLFEPTTKRICMHHDQNEMLESCATRIINISNDCLTLVLDHLGASSLAKLIKTGDKMFCSKVLHSAQRFHLAFTSSQEAVWPQLVS